MPNNSIADYTPRTQAQIAAARRKQAQKRLELISQQQAEIRVLQAQNKRLTGVLRTVEGNTSSDEIERQIKRILSEMEAV